MPDKSRSTRNPGGGSGGPAPTTPAPARAAGPGPDRDALQAGDADAAAAAYGNQAGAEARPQALADHVPSMLELAEVGGSFQLPANRELTGGWNPLSTGRGSTVSISMSATSLRVSMWPPMVVDAVWPMSNVEWSGFTYDFASASVSNVDTRNTQTFAFGASGFVDDAVRDFVTTLVRGTPLARAGYNPLRDPDAQGTLAKLYANVGAAGGGTAGPPPVAANEVTNLAPSATFKTRQEIVQGSSGGSIRIPAGTTISATAGLHGNAAELQQQGLSTIDWISMSTDGVELSHGGEPVARLQEVTVEHGGRIRVGRFEPLGKVREYGDVESGVRGLFLLLQVAAARGGQNPGQLQTNLNPDLVNGMAQSQIEQALSSAFGSVVRDHHDAIPGFDLRTVLGVARPGT